MKAKKLQVNTIQLHYLRSADAGGVIGCDRSTGKALMARGLAGEICNNFFQITDAGRERARKKADVVKLSTSQSSVDPTLLEDLPA